MSDRDNRRQDVRLWRQDSGRRDGPAVVLLHGFGGSHEDYEKVAGRLGESCRIIAFDLPAHGASGDYPGAAHPRAASTAVLEALSDQGVGTFHLCGFSMGGAVACLIAIGAPGRVLSLTLAAPGGFGTEIGADILREFGKARSETDVAGALQKMAGPTVELPKRVVADAIAQKLDPIRAEAQRELAERLFGGGVQGSIPRQMLEQITCPVEMVWGTDDAIVPFHQSENRPEAFRLTALPGAGHMLLAELPDAVALAIGRAMERSRGAG